MAELNFLVIEDSDAFSFYFSLNLSFSLPFDSFPSLFFSDSFSFSLSFYFSACLDFSAFSDIELFLFSSFADYFLSIFFLPALDFEDDWLEIDSREL